MIRLYQFAPAFGLPNASPFCMKVETYLRMAGLPYECARGASLLKAPKGKFPYIEDGGRRIADSTHIIDYLKAAYGDRLDAHLAPAERAAALALQRLMEENLYWAAIHARWVENAGFEFSRQAFFSRMPWLMRAVLPHLARRGMRRELHGHGMGRHSPAEIYAIGCRDIGALADWLGDKAYFLGEQPTSIDATAYAFIANLLCVPLETPLQVCAAGRSNLAAYCVRMKAQYYT